MLVEQVRQSPAPAGMVTIMLTSGGQPGDNLRCERLGIAAYLTKPVLQADLLEVLLKTLVHESNITKPAEVVTHRSLRQGRMPLRILLAEDNQVNQRLAVRL